MFRLTATAAGTMLASATAALAAGADAGPPRKDLPGVSQPEPIVKPLSEPLEQPPASADGFIKMGDWKVKISGYTRVDISSRKIRQTGR
jgi:hypothetical protein